VYRFRSLEVQVERQGFFDLDLSIEMFDTPIKIHIGLLKQAPMNVLLVMRAEFNSIESCAFQGNIRQRQIQQLDVRCPPCF